MWAKPKILLFLWHLLFIIFTAPPINAQDKRSFYFKRPNPLRADDTSHVLCMLTTVLIHLGTEMAAYCIPVILEN